LHVSLPASSQKSGPGGLVGRSRYPRVSLGDQRREQLGIAPSRSALLHENERPKYRNRKGPH
jgi:hypothetical protein